MMDWLVWVLVPIFGTAAILAVVRIVKGPSVLDRVVAADVLVATVICALAAEMAIHQHTFTIPVALILALFAVFGSISVAKFMGDQVDVIDPVHDEAVVPTSDLATGGVSTTIRSTGEGSAPKTEVDSQTSAGRVVEEGRETDR